MKLAVLRGIDSPFERVTWLNQMIAIYLGCLWVNKDEDYIDNTNIVLEAYMPVDVTAFNFGNYGPLGL